MGHAERIVMGVILIASAFEVYVGSSKSHSFELLVSWISNGQDTTKIYFEAVQLCRQISAVLIIGSGIALIANLGVWLACFSQLYIICLTLLSSKQDGVHNILSMITPDLALLIYLIAERSDAQADRKQKMENKVANGDKYE